jgi:hypothetical protein
MKEVDENFVESLLEGSGVKENVKSIDDNDVYHLFK